MFSNLQTLAILIFAGVYFLFLLKKALARELQALSLLLFHRTKPGFIFYKFLVFPGIIIHELSHWLMAEILQVRTGEIRILPKDDSVSPIGDKRLGFVKIAKTDPLRSLFIGFAPLLVGVFFLTLLSHLLFSLQTNFGLSFLFAYLLLVVGNGMLVSRSDVRFWPFFLIIIITLFYLLSTTSFSLPTAQLITWIKPIFHAVFLTVGIELLIVLLLFSFRSLLEKLTRRKIGFFK